MLARAGAAFALGLFSVAGHATVIESIHTIGLYDIIPAVVGEFVQTVATPSALDLSAERSTGDLSVDRAEEGAFDDGGGAHAVLTAGGFHFPPLEMFGQNANEADGIRFPTLAFQPGPLVQIGGADLLFGPTVDGHLRIAYSDHLFHRGPARLAEGVVPGATVASSTML